MITLTDLCKELKNWFATSIYHGTFTIKDGAINLADMVSDGSLQSGQYFRIVGSVFNDGVHQHPATELNDETFNGAVWAMAVPREVIMKLDEINAWVEKYGADLQKPYQSESFGGYSYSLKGSLSGGSGAVLEPWKAQFGSWLNKWRKIR